jgi:hypothetical protein
MNNNLQSTENCQDHQPQKELCKISPISQAHWVTSEDNGKHIKASSGTTLFSPLMRPNWDHILSVN